MLLSVSFHLRSTPDQGRTHVETIHGSLTCKQDHLSPIWATALFRTVQKVLFQTYILYVEFLPILSAVFSRMIVSCLYFYSGTE